MKHWRIIWAFPNPRCPCLEDCKLNTDSCMPCNYIQLWRYIFMLKYSRLSGIFPGLPGAAQSPVTRVTGVIEYLGWRISQMITLHSTPNHSRYERPDLQSVRTSVRLHIQLSRVFSAPSHMSRIVFVGECRSSLHVSVIRLSSEMLTVCCRRCRPAAVSTLQ